MSKDQPIFWGAELSGAGMFPEGFSDEQRMIASLTADFVGNEILPMSHDIDEMTPGLMAELMQKAGELGLLAPDVPEEWGGMGLELSSSLLITENFGPAASFAVSHSDHTALGTLPIVLFGNDEQKARYLPGLASGAAIAAYALTEGSSGSDALAARTKATLSADRRHYLLNGSKQFITNAGLADVFVTYARVDGDSFTAFLIDRETPGLSLGAEEKKMGISGSSTRSVVLEDAKVPAENVLYEVGKGRVVAFTALNIGRLKLAVQCVGAAKAALGHAAKYALDREQFGQPIAKYGLVQGKLARMAATIYAAESMAYRTSARLDAAIAGSDCVSSVVAAIGGFAAECSMNKVFASEMLDMVADEAVQIFGGYGYSKEYPAERIYRDARINRIFGGTSEINRLLVAKALVGECELAVPQDVGTPAIDPLPEDRHIVVSTKTAVLRVLKTAMKKWGGDLPVEQEILALIADAATDVIAMESGLLRAASLVETEGRENAVLQVDLLRSFMSEAVPRVRQRCAEVLTAADETNWTAAINEIDELMNFAPANGIALRRHAAAHVLDSGGYPLV